MGIVYVPREEVKTSLEISRTSYSDRIIDRRSDSASRSVEACTHRRFYPELATRYFDWPNYQYAPSWRLYLDDNELISVTTLVAGGTTIAASDYFLRRMDDKDEPPYSYIDIDLSSAAAFQSGDTWQRAIAITGLFGYNDVTVADGQLNGGINNSVTTMDIEPVNSQLYVSVGSLIKVDTERMIIIERTMIDTTQNLLTDLTASKADTLVEVASGASFAINEVILLDSERMRIVDIAGNYLSVIRAWDGTVLAAHVGSDVYAARRFTVQRGALGTTAASHSDNASVRVQEYPALVTELALAETIVLLEQNAAAYARTVGTGDNQRESSGRGLKMLQEETYTAYGRKLRKGAI